MVVSCGAVLLVEDVTERTKLEQAIETRANQLAALTDVSTRITAALEREEVINLALDEMGWIIPFDVMMIWRRNGSYMVLEGESGGDLTHMGEVRMLISEDERIQQIVESIWQEICRATHVTVDLTGRDRVTTARLR